MTLPPSWPKTEISSWQLLQFNFIIILGLNFVIFCFKLIVIHYRIQKQKKIRFKPRKEIEPQHSPFKDVSPLKNKHQGLGFFFRAFFQFEEVAMPYVQLLADFRDEVRNVAREEKGNAKLFIPLFVLLLPHSELFKKTLLLFHFQWQESLTLATS